MVVARGGDLGQPLGVLQKDDLVADLIAGARLATCEAHVREPLYVPENIPVLRMLEMFRSVPMHVAFVVDEYGDFLGLATLTDILEAIAGDMPQEHQHSAEQSGQTVGRLMAGRRARVDRRARRYARPRQSPKASFTPPPGSRSSGSRASRWKATRSRSAPGRPR